jgi:hypothetical protein
MDHGSIHRVGIELMGLPRKLAEDSAIEWIFDFYSQALSTCS